MKSRISRILREDLFPREAFILDERFGISTGVPRTLEQVGALLEPQVTRERVRGIEARAIRRLRHPSRSRKITAVLKSDWSHIAEVPKFTDVRGKPIEELEISVKLYNCLRNRLVKTLGDVLRFSGHDLMRSKNFGRRSLEELVAVLRKHRLRLPDSPGRDLTLIFIKSTKKCRGCKHGRREERCVICGRGLCNDCASTHDCPKLQIFRNSAQSAGVAFRKLVYVLTVLRRGEYEPYSQL